MAVIPRSSATVLLVRDAPAFEVLMVKRHHQIDFAGGALVFPGGKVEAQDEAEAWSDLSPPGCDAAERPLRVAAIREAFEECGVLLARDAAGATLRPGADLDAARAALAGGVAFAGLAAGLGATLDLEALIPFARWITPEMMPKRFDTWFYLAEAPADQLAACDGTETVDAEWIAPAEALRLAELGQRRIIFPTRMNLQRLAESGSVAQAKAAARARPMSVVTPHVEQRPGGPMLVLPEEAGYGRVEEPLSSAT